MACNDDVSNVCMDPIKATCVDYDEALGANTKITEDCVNQSEVNIDLYAILDEAIANADATAELTGNCLTYPLINGVILVKTALETHADAICDHETRVATIEAIDYSTLDITGWGLTIPACISDPCASPPTTLGPLLQAIMDNRNCT